MKKLDINPITDSASMPLKAGTLEFLQLAHQETTSAIINGLLGYTPDPTKGYITAGMNVTVAGSLYTFTDGYIYFNGELFKVNASSFTLAGGEQVFGIISNIPYLAADPVMFGDNILRSVHLDRQISFVSATSGDLLYANVIKSGVWLTGDLKEIDCTNVYLSENFDGTGLGINERKGWAICNGNNGTKNRNGKMSLAYGANYLTMGAIGGSKDAVVVEHSHPVKATTRNVMVLDAGSEGVFRNNPTSTNADGFTTDTVGVSGTDKNLPPYIVTLFIQKI